MDDKELHSLLFSAIRHHNVSLLDDLLDGEAGKNLLDLPGESGNMLLHSAVLENETNCVRCLLEHGANPNVFDTIRARTPLHLAVELDQTDMVKAFLELEQINLDIRDDRNLTCYEIAQFCDKQNLADLIQARQNDINRLKDEFYSLMNQACSKNEPNTARELLKRYERRIIDKLPRSLVSSSDRRILVQSGLKDLINWSSSSWNDVTLLFKSASKGHTEICRLLIDYGATAKCNDNTNYSPLYVAAYGGFTDTVKLLLDSFPSLVHEVTIEKWTVLHACCLQGHSDTARLILTYPYADELKHRFVSRSGVYEYYFAFDLNAQDAAGQTVVYLSVSANNEKLLDTLLQFNVEANFIEPPLQTTATSHKKDNWSKSYVKSEPVSNNHAKVIHEPKSRSNTSSYYVGRASDRVEKIIRQLKKLDTDDTGSSDKVDELATDKCKYLICPFEMDTYCDYNSKTALHLAVCQQYHSIATTLLVNGSNPNLPILSRDTVKSDFTNLNSDTGLNWLRSSKSTCLKEACRLNDELMCETLIRYGASDNQDNLALKVAASNKNNLLISKFLSLKSNIDPEYKINNKCNVEFASRFKQSQKLSKTLFGNATTTFSSMFPSSPVMIDWQNLKCIRKLDPQWLIDASLMHNKRLKHNTTSLIAITRLDLSSNNLKTIHPVIFRLPSLRELNLSNNRLESLGEWSQRGSIEGNTNIPTSKLIESHRIAMKRSKSSNMSSINLEGSNIIDLNEPQEWDLPYLESLDLHDNRLIALPDCLFELPKLTELDVSSNQIRQLPWSMWTAPSLREIIASGNLLDDLPKLPQQQRGCSSPQLRINYNESPSDERSSLTSNQSISNDRVECSYLNYTDSCATNEKDQSSYINSFETVNMQLSCSTTPLVHLNYWKKRIDLATNLTTSSSQTEDNSIGDGSLSISKITYLNLSHNSFAVIPPVLACVATELTRLNISHNRLVALGSINYYPSSLKSLDLSNNQIASWFIHDKHDNSSDCCYLDNSRRDTVISKFLFSQHGSWCPHKVHLRLENLKSLNLSHNILKDIQLTLDPYIDATTQSKSLSTNSIDSSSYQNLRDLLTIPNVTALDVSFNRIQQIPKHVSELKDISVLNIGGNVSISSLPAELGLNTKLWNLGISGCCLNEPLKSIVESKTYKTIDIIGYLRSILEEAKPYARMKLMLVGQQGIGKTSLLEQMRLEGSSNLRRRAPEHWTKRMGHTTKSNIRNQKGVTLSTVGIDIHDWVFCKRVARNQHSFGSVSFSTWDFGGQQEFYATHRYFLSKRSMYLVVWRLTDGIDGIHGIQQWLVNIQSRAPGSPVIVVGTHEDLVEGGESGDVIKHLKEEIHRLFIDIADPDKCGLPRVLDFMTVSTKTRLNIRNLCNRIYDVVFAIRCPGSSERLLEQKIPATYLYLEEIVSWIVHERQQKKIEPVLMYEEYKKLTSEQLKIKYGKVFRDLEPPNSREINCNSELQQATRFLHENGVLLHYEDANLRDLYFLDPQWLCDILSHVVTIREINPHVKNGLMKINDLCFLFKSNNVNFSGGIQSYLVNLLNKFEVALTWNSQYLLIPSLLPNEPHEFDSSQGFPTKLAPKVRGRSAVRRHEPGRLNPRATSVDPTKALSINSQVESKLKVQKNYSIECQPSKHIHRLVLLRYLPAGFLARLQSGILSDPIFDDICAELHTKMLEEAGDCEILKECLGNQTGWTCWRSGIKMVLKAESATNSKFKLDAPLLTIQEFSTTSKDTLFSKINLKVDSTFSNLDYPNASIENKSKSNVNKWINFDIGQYSNVILITVSSWVLQISDKNTATRCIEPANRCISKLLANAVDHIDNLLEDWYPSLGTRFAHTLAGNYLVTRIIPCLSCFSSLSFIGRDSTQRSTRFDTRTSRSSNKVNFTFNSRGDSYNSYSSQKVNPFNDDDYGDTEVFSYYVEHSILNAYDIQVPQNGSDMKYSLNFKHNPKQKRSFARNLHCPKHGTVAINEVAPDVVFDDVPDYYKIDNEQIERCKLIGRGTFGFVFRGSLRNGVSNMEQLGNRIQEVALKLLQPVDPGSEADQTDTLAYNTAKSNWLREPFQHACKSYCTARHEIKILQTLNHPNIVVFIGLCVKPLAIVLELATMGCLTDIFKTYKKAGVRVDRYSIRKTILQVAKALEYLHQQRVIYRDLKAENVLVWSFPSPFATQLQDAPVELKLADYGISRQTLCTGVWKGFAGTINFLAPEILRHNGDEEYTEKVDCFSFGMFMYELLTLRPPFKHNEGIKSHLADGRRPTLSMQDLIYPNYIVDLMSICWSQEPQHRPTASQIVSIASTPEFMQLLDVVALDSQSKVEFCEAIQYSDSNGFSVDLWFGRQLPRLEIISTDQGHWAQHHQILSLNTSTSFNLTCMCVVENTIWLCNQDLTVYVVPLGTRLKNQSDSFKPIIAKESQLKNQDETLDQALSFKLELKCGKASILQIIFVASARSVLMLTTSGQLWIHQLETMECKQLDDSSIPFKCIAVQESTSTESDSFLSKDTRFDLYCGQSNGISSIKVVNNAVYRHSILPFVSKSLDTSGECLIESNHSTEVTSIVASKDFLWTSAGCTIHLWSVKDKSVIRKLDCWKLVPCSESLESINIESYYQHARTSVVSSLAYLNNQLFVGTSHGCFMVVEADSLKPMIVFRPYESDIRIITPTVIRDNLEDGNVNYLITIGSGYRDLMKRYVSLLDFSDVNTNDVAILWSADYYNY